MRRRGVSKIYLYPSIFIIAVVGLAVFRIVAGRWGAERDFAVQPVTTQPTTQAAPPPVVEKEPEAPKPIADLLGVLLADDPAYPTTQPLDLPADLEDAARIVIRHPVYLDLFGRLWITHPRGTPVADLLDKPLDGRTFVVTERVRYVSIALSGETAVFVGSDAAQVTRIAKRKRDVLTIPAGVRWDQATRFNEADVVAPCDQGAVRIGADSVVPELIPLELPPGANPPRLLSAGDRFLVWSPFEDDKVGSPVAYLVDAKGKRPLSPATGFFDRPIQFVILADGSILGVGRTDDGVELKLKSLDKPPPRSPEQIESLRQLARELANPDPLVREKTQSEIEALGPGIYPELEAMRERLPAEAQVRIEIILGQRFAPTLASIKPLPGLAQTVARFADGGCVLLLTGGGSIADDGIGKTVIPAWIAIRPGNYIERLPDRMVEGFVPGRYQFFAFGSEWVIYDPVLGLRRWIGSEFVTLLDKPLRHFDTLVRIDQQRRWIIRSSSEPDQTLIIDPSLPDTTPRLPVWMIEAPDGAGWTQSGWPAMNRGDSVLVLDEKRWRVMDPKTDTFDRTAPKLVTTVATAPDGTKFELINNRVTRNGSALIDDARGAMSIFLTDDRIFLVGEGVVHRFSRAGKFEAMFDKGLLQNPKRVWIDPAGRLVLAGDASLWIAFPSGRVPGAIKTMMIGKPSAE